MNLQAEAHSLRDFFPCASMQLFCDSLLFSYSSEQSLQTGHERNRRTNVSTVCILSRHRIKLRARRFQGSSSIATTRPSRTFWFSPFERQSQWRSFSTISVIRILKVIQRSKRIVFLYLFRLVNFCLSIEYIYLSHFRFRAMQIVTWSDDQRSSCIDDKRRQ